MPVVINGDTGITQAGEFDSDSSFGFKNRIINPGMVLDQRNAGASSTTTNTYTVDRFVYRASQASKGTWGQNLNAVTPPAGFTNYLGFQSSSAYTVGASEVFDLEQSIEANNTSDLGFGTANAKTVTISFWVYSSLTGVFAGTLRNYDANRAYGFNYTIAAANTWTYITVQVPGDTGGTWTQSGSAGSMSVSFTLGVGSNYAATANTWSTGGVLLGGAGGVSVVGTNGATFYITGVQLEKGSTATSFDFRSYGTELQLCQRYFQKTYNIEVAVGTASGAGPAITRASASTQAFLVELQRFMQVSMRATPTVTAYSSNTGASGKVHVSGSDVTVTSINDAGTYSFGYPLITSTPSAGNDCRCHYVASAEL